MLTPTERRNFLIDALRAPMPENFSWDFNIVCEPQLNCGSAGCALALAAMMWPKDFGLKDNSTFEEISEAIYDTPDTVLAEMFGIAEEKVYSVFWGVDCYETDIEHTRVPPNLVADRLALLGLTETAPETVE